MWCIIFCVFKHIIHHFLWGWRVRDGKGSVGDSILDDDAFFLSDKDLEHI